MLQYCKSKYWTALEVPKILPPYTVCVPQVKYLPLRKNSRRQLYHMSEQAASSLELLDKMRRLPQLPELLWL